MNIKDELISVHSKENALKIARYIGQDAHKFTTLMDLFLNGEYRIVQRAAWVVSKCTDQYPELLPPFLEEMILNLQKDVSVAVKRNTMRALQNVEVPEELMGPLAEVCFAYLESSEEPVAVKVFAMTNLFNITKKEPDLKNELRIILETQLPYGSAGFKSRAKKILKEL